MAAPSASAVNVVELVLGMEDPTPLHTKLSETENTAEKVVKSIQGNITNLKDTALETAKTLSTGMKDTTSALYQHSVGSFDEVNKWAHSLTGLLKARFPGIAEGVEAVIVNPLTSAFKWIKEAANETVSGLITKTKSGTMQAVALETTTGSVITRLFTQTLATVDLLCTQVIEKYPLIGKGIEGVWLSAQAAAIVFTTALSVIPTTLIIALGLTKTFATATIEAFRGIIKSAAVGIRVFTDTTKWIYSNVAATVAWIGKVTGLGWALKKARSLATFALKVTGVTAALGVVGSFFAGAKSSMGGLFGPGSAIGVFMDHISAALMPLAAELTKLAVKIAPLIVQLLSPLLDLVMKGVSMVTKMIDGMMAGGGQFSGFMQHIGKVVEQVAGLVFNLIASLGKNLLPVLVTVLEVFTQLFADVAQVVFPIIAKLLERLLPILKSTFEALAPVVSELLRTLASVVGPLLMEVAEALVPIIEALVSSLPDITPALMDMAGAIGELIRALMPLLIIVIKVASLIASKILAPVVTRALKWIIKSVTIIARLLTDTVLFAVELLGGSVVRIFDKITSTIGGFFKWLANITERTLGGAFSFIATSWQNIKAFLGIDTLASGLKGVFGTVVKALELPFNLMKKFINYSVIEPLNWLLSYDLPIIGKLSKRLGITPPKPMFTGGIAVKPTLATIGEKGPELVLPLTQASIEKVAPALTQKEVITIQPPQVKTITPERPEFPKKIETEHGKDTLGILVRIAEMISEYGKRPVQEVEPFATDMPVPFTMRGFNVS